MHKPWYKLKRLYAIVVALLVFVAWFWWESYTTSENQYVSKIVTNAVDNAFQSAVLNVSRNSLEQNSLNGGPSYLIPQFGSYSQNGFQNSYNLQAGFAYNLSRNQLFPLYQIESFGVWQFYDEVDVTVQVKYSLRFGFTDTAYVRVKETAPKKPIKK